jgi:hypothetical protein
MEEKKMRGYDRGYDYGLRGFREAAQWREPVRTRFVGRDGWTGRGFRRPAGRYGGDYDGYEAGPFSNRVTARYNLDYVREQHPGERPVNYVPYGGDRIGRVSDGRDYPMPYQTSGGTRTRRGEWPMGWERQQARYGADFPRPRSDLGRWF